MTPTPVDHLLAVLLAVVLPIYVFLRYRSFLRAVARGEEGARRREYQETMAVEWGLTIAVLAVWWWAGRGAEDMWLDAGELPGAAWAWGIALLATGLLLLQWRAVTGDPERLRQVREKLASVEEFLPHTRAEGRWFAALSVTAGVCEEVLFRGFLLAYVMALAGPWVAAVVTSVAFGLCHAYQGAGGAVRSAVLGLASVGLVLLAGSLWPAVVAHAAVDLVSGGMVREALAADAPAGEAGPA